MKVTSGMARLVVAPLVILLAAGCSDKAGERTPTGVSAIGPGALAASQSVGNDGSGSNFKVFGAADVTRDPENPANIVLQVVSTASSTPAGVYRKLNNVQVWQLDHQLNFHRAFVAPHTCGGGSPRVILLIDSNGDGEFQTAPEGPDFAANGHVRPPFVACETSAPSPNTGGPAPSTLLWRFEDLTDEQTRWEITGNTVPGFPPYPGPNWDAFEGLISTAFPNHRVLEAIFLEDFNPTPGVAYYDLITVQDLTLGTRGQWQPERGRRNNGGLSD